LVADYALGSMDVRSGTILGTTDSSLLFFFFCSSGRRAVALVTSRDRGKFSLPGPHQFIGPRYLNRGHCDQGKKRGDALGQRFMTNEPRSRRRFEKSGPTAELSLLRSALFGSGYYGSITGKVEWAAKVSRKGRCPVRSYDFSPPGRKRAFHAL